MGTYSYSQCFTRLFDVHGNDPSGPLMDVQGWTSSMEETARFFFLTSMEGVVLFPPLGCHGRDALSLLSTSMEGCTSHPYSTSMLGVANPVKIFTLLSIEENALSLSWGSTWKTQLSPSPRLHSSLLYRSTVEDLCSVPLLDVHGRDLPDDGQLLGREQEPGCKAQLPGFPFLAGRVMLVVVMGVQVQGRGSTLPTERKAQL